MDDALYMKRALLLAAIGSGNTAPNPMVGAVLVHNGRVIGEGWHKQNGQAHAEVNCLDSVAAGDRQLIKESTMYVTLEPCAHHGKTPPCADRLVTEGLKRVVIANTDPFTKVNGKGVAILKEAGIEVQTGLLEQEGRWLNRRFFCMHTLGRPYIILKWAQTADGFIAPLTRQPIAITGADTAVLVHQWRAQEAAIMVGTTTARNDNPQLTARLWQGRQPLRIMLDRKLTLPTTANIYNTDAPTWVVNEGKEEHQGHITFVKSTFDDKLLPTLLARLHSASVLSVIVEGGAALLSSFIAAGLWDEARILTAATTLGSGVAAPSLCDAAHAFSSQVGPDLLSLFVNNASKFTYTPNAAI